ncbi:MAG: hypothetical protein LUD69_08325 [Oscillospiraceae bacterium]|nr:hypothetical protein [Oscillospiraceae bacterium]
MAEEGNRIKNATKQTRALIDPMYDRFVDSLLKTVGSTEFYQYFMQTLAAAETEIDFSNRHLEKHIDEDWIESIEDAIPALQSIVSAPIQVIQEEEILVNVSNAKKCTPDTVRHLAQNANLVEDYREDTGEVRPSRLLQKIKVEQGPTAYNDGQSGSTGNTATNVTVAGKQVSMYDNQVVFTVLEMAGHFVRVRYQALTEAMNQEQGARLKLKTHMTGPLEEMDAELSFHVTQKDDFLETDELNRDAFSRIARLQRLLDMMMNTQFAREMSTKSRIRGNLVRTNVLKRNPQYRKAAELYDTLRDYDRIGYTLLVRDQDPTVSEEFQQDIFMGVLFQYMTLKRHLADEDDRRLPAGGEEHLQELKPKFIHQIVEERTEDYNLPDVEVRKVLIEEMTRADLMKEESAERRRLVEEQAQRKREEAQRLKEQQQAERERIRAEKQAEKERQRQQEEQLRRQQEEQRRLAEREERLKMQRLQKELSRFFSGLSDRLDQREQANEQLHQIQSADDYADAVQMMEQEERRRRQERERREREKREAEQALRLQQEQAMEKARQEQERARQREQERLDAQAAERAAPYAREAERFRQELEEHLAARRRAAAQAAERKRVELP